MTAPATLDVGAVGAAEPRGPPRAWGAIAAWTTLAVLVVAAVAAATTAHGRSAAWWYLTLVALVAAGMLVVWHLARRLTATQVTLLVVVGAALLRVVLVPSTPVLSTDVYRYLWDGRVQASGVNPYRYPPAAAELEPLRDETVWRRINRKPERTIYPGGAQMVFRAAQATGIDDPTSWKAVAVTADLITVVLLVRLLRRRRLPIRHALLYAWNPMVVLAVAQSGHVDAFVTPLLVGAVLAWDRDRPGTVGSLLGVAGALKLYPLLTLPALVRRRDGRFGWAVAPIAAAVVGVSYLPYLSAGRSVGGYLTTGYLQEEGYESGHRFVLASLVGLDHVAVVGAAIAVVACWTLVSRRPPLGKALVAWATALVLTTPYPWYALALVALATVAPDVRVRLLWPLFGVALYVVYLVVYFGYRPLAPSSLRLVLALGTVGVLSSAVAGSVGPVRRRRKEARA